MTALEAVEKYDKVRLPETAKDVFASRMPNGALMWCHKIEGLTGAVTLHNIMRTDWEAVNCEKEIRPQVEDVWRNKDCIQLCFIGKTQGGTLVRVWSDRVDDPFDVLKYMAHGKDGWERVFPEVNSDS